MDHVSVPLELLLCVNRVIAVSLCLLVLDMHRSGQGSPPARTGGLDFEANLKRVARPNTSSPAIAGRSAWIIQPQESSVGLLVLGDHGY